jgi:hypothetical protein
MKTSLIALAAILSIAPSIASAQTVGATRAADARLPDPVLEDDDTAPLRSSAMLFGGYTSPTDGYEDRYYGGLIVDKYVGDVGIHLDTVGVSREDSGLYGAIGTSFSIAPGIRPKLSFGGSTDVRNILPKYFAQGQLRTQLGKSTVATPSYTFRQFRTGVEEHQAALDVAHYFDLGDPNGYYVAQARGAYAVLPGKDAPSGGIGITAVRASGVSLGVYGEYGRLAYANLVDIGAPGIQSEFYAIRPSLGIRIDRTIEFVVRGEYSHNDFFETRGVFLGLKANLD